MRISLTGVPFRLQHRQVGYGEAAYHIHNSLQELGLDVEIEAKRADIELCFADPGNYVFFDHSSYKIGYSAWESTEMTSDFKINVGLVDELWGTSNWTTNVYKMLFPDKKIFTYQHGISKAWKPKMRKEANKPFTFLHIGEPFSRKDAQTVVDCFVSLFGNDPNYRLILKCHKINTTRVIHPVRGFDCSPAAAYDNIYEISGMLSEEQMLGLYDMSDVFVYPSWGEGFGLQPLQALAKGIPTICTEGWADYAKYITWPTESLWWKSPWQDKHPGLMLMPNKEQVKSQMWDAVQNYEKVLPTTFKNAFLVHEEFDWLNVTKPAVERLHEIYSEIQVEKKYFNLDSLKKRSW